MPSTGWIRRLAMLPVPATVVPMAAPARAQYFGQNKVHYQSFRFEVLKAEHDRRLVRLLDSECRPRGRCSQS